MFAWHEQGSTCTRASGRIKQGPWSPRPHAHTKPAIHLYSSLAPCVARFSSRCVCLQSQATGLDVASLLNHHECVFRCVLVCILCAREGCSPLCVLTLVSPYYLTSFSMCHAKACQRAHTTRDFSRCFALLTCIACFPMRWCMCRRAISIAECVSARAVIGVTTTPPASIARHRPFICCLSLAGVKPPCVSTSHPLIGSCLRITARF